MQRCIQLLAAAALCAAAQAKVNILMIASDDMRPEIADPYGIPFMHTPNIARLAKAGTSFRFAYCQVAVCAPSRTALLTGVRNDWTRVWTIGPYFRASMGTQADPAIFKTLPQMFKEHGYNTTGAGKIFHGGGPSGGQGCCGGYDMPFSWTEPYWDCDQFWTQLVQSPASVNWTYGAGNTAQDKPPYFKFVQSGTGCVQSPECIACLTEHSGLGHELSWAAAPCDDSCYPDGLVAEQTIRALRYKAAHPEQPFFLAAGFKRPHLGFYAPQWAYDLYPNASIALAQHRTPPVGMPEPAFCEYGSMRTFEDTDKGAMFINSSELSSPATPGKSFQVKLLPDWKHYELRRGYYAAVSFVDAQVGKLLDTLEQLELRENTAVLMWG